MPRSSARSCYYIRSVRLFWQMWGWRRFRISCGDDTYDTPYGYFVGLIHECSQSSALFAQENIVYLVGHEALATLFFERLLDTPTGHRSHVVKFNEWFNKLMQVEEVILSIWWRWCSRRPAIVHTSDQRSGTCSGRLPEKVKGFAWHSAAPNYFLSKAFEQLPCCSRLYFQENDCFFEEW